MKPRITNPNNIILLPTDRFIITGRQVCGRRFRIITTNPRHAFGINLWNGSIWLERDGRRMLLQRVTASHYTIVKHINGTSNRAPF